MNSSMHATWRPFEKPVAGFFSADLTQIFADFGKSYLMIFANLCPSR
jgi:hypothetical protein